MAFKLSTKSKTNLKGVHPVLKKIVERAIELTTVDFMVNEGLRTKTRQKELVAAGASKTMNSRHISGHAVDLVAMLGSEITWKTEYYTPIAIAMKKAAAEQGCTSLIWGGDWPTFKDLVHFELSAKKFPA